MKKAGVIFDLDGTLIDTKDLWGKAFAEALRNLGKKVNDKHPEIPGVSIEDNWPIILKKYQVSTDKSVDELKDLTYKCYVKFLPEVSLIEGAKDFLDNLKDAGIKVALATNSEWWVVEEIFAKLGLEGIFDATVTGEETPNKKPFPDAFLLAADKIGINLEDCLVIGDTAVDIEAARRAGMRVIAMTQEVPPAKGLEKADFVARGFSEITPAVIDQL